jgi:chemotaxis protein methyltransferase CheR
MSALRPTPAPPRPRTAASADDYPAFCAGVQRLCGVDLAQYKRGQMERRIRTFAQHRGTDALPAYLVALQCDSAELDLFLDRVTINVSQLWRNPEQWDALGRTVIPELAAGARGALRAWSAGCSYGAEAYTLAATCAEAAPGLRVQIVGTDIDGRMVARAREGRFSAENARTGPADALRRWFVREPDGGLTAGPELRRGLRFETGDLLRMRFPREAYDLVLCRNTVIYFNEDVRDELHAHLVGALRPGGYLVIGSTERVADPRGLGLESTRPFTYRKR